MNPNLILAAIWAVVAVVLFILGADPDARIPRLWGSNISIAWVCVFLAVYNVLRWATTRSARSGRPQYRDTFARRSPPPREEDEDLSPRD